MNKTIVTNEISTSENICNYNILNYTEPKITDCIDCKNTYELPNEYCCLHECGEHEFCRNCNRGIYIKSNCFQKGEF